jgi:hypothetical protein
VIALSAADIRERGLRVGQSGEALGWSLKLVSEKTGELQPVAQYRVRDAVRNSEIIVSPDMGWSYNPGEGYRPDLAKYQGKLAGLAQRELGERP